jgi:GNAT superfamily N-acetyltransferase
MKNFEIRRAGSVDVPMIIHCVDSAYQHYIPVLGKAPGPMLDDYARVVQEHEVYVVGHDEQKFGVLVLRINDARILLDNVAVSSGFQGQGMGKKLVEFAEFRAVELGYSEIELYTHELMKENILMYRKWGYEICRRVREKGYDRIYMRKVFDAK